MDPNDLGLNVLSMGQHNNDRLPLYGRKFTLQTDHKPLLSLFGKYHAISSQASTRIQRCALTLSMHKYSIVLKLTACHTNADAMSQLPLENRPESSPLPAELVIMIENLQDTPITAAQIKEWTMQNPQLARVLQFIHHGWPNNCDADLQPFWSQRTELTVQDRCLLWGSCVTVPCQGLRQMLREMHVGHPDIARMKGLARAHIL